MKTSIYKPTEVFLSETQGHGSAAQRFKCCSVETLDRGFGPCLYGYIMNVDAFITSRIENCKAFLLSIHDSNNH